MLSTSDVDVLYRSSAAYLQRLVRLGARAPEDVVQDACQHAWSSVLAHRDCVARDGAFAWLTSTAVHEAWRLSRHGECAWPIEAIADGPSEDEDEPPVRVATYPSCVETVELRDRIDALRRLPVRQQRLLWLHAAGFSYAEMARHEGATVRTVERQLLRGRRAARALDGDGCSQAGQATGAR